MSRESNEGILCPEDIRKAIAMLYQPGQVFECRIVKRGKPTLSGYFKDADTLLRACDNVDLRNYNVYTTLQDIKPECYDMPQQGHFVAGADTTSDKMVNFYQWLFVDIDPVRVPAQISSSDEELQEAYDIAGRIAEYLQELGFTQPIKAVSGNGAHLLYPVCLDSSKENESLIKGCLQALSLRFDTPTCKVDTANFNPSRICKLYGTLAQKGTSSEARPHRMSRIFTTDYEREPVRRMYLKKLAAEVPEVEPATQDNRYNGYNRQEFNLEDWMLQHGLRVRSKDAWNGCTKYVLECCPFDSSHRGKDAVIFQDNSGKIGFKCFHNSCQGKGWKDVRLLFEPDAYSQRQAEIDRQFEEGWEKHNRAKEAAAMQVDNEPAFMTVSDILAVPDVEPEYIRTGITVIDRLMHGLAKGAISLLTGLRGSAKSTLLGQIILQAVEDGHRVIAYSGELSGRNFIRWLLRQAAGRHFVSRSNRYQNAYVVNDEVVPAISEWIADRLWIYNNDRGHDFSVIKDRLFAKAREVQADFLVLDNLMSLDISGLSESGKRGYYDKLEAQKSFVQELKRTALECNVHVLFVAHPRKAQGFLRLDDVSGSGDLTNAVDNAFIIHRNNRDYQTNVRSYYKASEAYIARRLEDGKEVYAALCSNVLEICKDRENGTCDKLIPLWFEEPTKRLLNDESEYIQYGWYGSYQPADSDGAIPF